MSAYIKALQEQCERVRLQRAEEERANIQRVREILTPLEHRLARLLETIPIELQREGLNLSSLQAALRGRRGGKCHPGELGAAMRKLGFSRIRQWAGDQGFRAIWRKLS